MKKKRLVLIGCLLLLALIMGFIISGLYSTPTALASEYNETPTTQTSEYNETPTTQTSEYDETASDLDNKYCGEIGYLPPNPALNEAENRGRCTWYLWTGGNETLYRTLAVKTKGQIDLLKTLDSRQHDERFKTLGAMNDPGCKKADKPDEYGLWLDECKDSHSTGVIGMRKFKNPNFVETFSSR